MLSDEFTLKVGCIPGEVVFSMPEIETMIELNINDDPANIYTIADFTSEPPDINCPVKQYDIVP